MRNAKVQIAIAAVSLLLIGLTQVILPASFYTIVALLVLANLCLVIRRLWLS